MILAKELFFAFNPKIILVKFDDHLAAYLYENKSLKLEGLGTFTLDDQARVPGEQEKEVYYPIEGLAFNFNPRSATEESIITFLVKRLGKIEPLIRSDLEFYLSNIKQLLNIGKPYTIEGIGTLSKNNQGIYEFTPGNFLPVKEELHPKRENADHNYPVRSKSSAGRIFVIVLIVIIALSALGGISWGVFNFVKNQPTPDEVTQQQGESDTIIQETDSVQTKTNSENPLKSSNNTSPPAVTTKPVAGDTGSVTYKMIFEVTKSKERAYSRTAQLNELHSPTQYDSIPINDSISYYRLFLMMKIPPADTSHVKDSLRIFFGKRIFIEKQ